MVIDLISKVSCQIYCENRPLRLIFNYLFSFLFSDEPGKPGDLQVTDWDKDHIDLKWTPPASDGGSPLTGYVVEVKDKLGNWEKCMDVPPSQTTASVPDLVQGQAYEFRVRAVNKAGPGEPSDATPPTVAKPRRCKFLINLITSF